MKTYENQEKEQDRGEGLVNAIADHELKALTLLAMEEKGWYSPWELQGRISNLAGVPRDRLVGHNTFRSYCLDSFAPIGLAVRNLEGSDRVEFEITPFGLREGKALAGHMLQLASTLPDSLSLQKIFGMTHSKNEDVRAPINRARILSLVYKGSGEGVPLTEIAKYLGEDSGTTKARLDSMLVSGILGETKRPPRGNRYVAMDHQKISGRVGNRSTKASVVVQGLVQDVSDISPMSPFWTEEVHRYLVDSLGYEDDTHTRSAVKKRLEVLAGRGALQLIQTEETSHKILLPIEEYRSYIEQAVSIVERTLIGDSEFIEEGLTKAEQIQNNPVVIRELIRRAIANSPQAQSDWAQSMMQKSHL